MYLATRLQWRPGLTWWWMLKKFFILIWRILPWQGCDTRWADNNDRCPAHSYKLLQVRASFLEQAHGFSYAHIIVKSHCCHPISPQAHTCAIPIAYWQYNMPSILTTTQTHPPVTFLCDRVSIIMFTAHSPTWMVFSSPLTQSVYE